MGVSDDKILMEINYMVKKVSNLIQASYLIYSLI